ncbi:MAG TPA: mechanosensitive ion channel domain-containing protein [Longimicrobiales bacterium]|nr:mechanosensitive ion channel domain-containing protein [Longimicrobiales bacterium]
MLEALRSIDWAELVNWQEVAADAARIALILLLSLVGYRVVKLATRRLEREVDEENPLDKRRREQRLRTVGSLLNSVAAVVIAGLALLMILSTFVEIAPLLATAGVAGLAISFGAQSLVKDVLTGIFLMVEEQFAIGDVVRIKEVTGLVERITLRTTVLRDVEGTVHVIPNGEITMLSNLTKGWSKAVLDIGVAYREDVDRVLDVVREECGKLWRDEDWSEIILEEPEVPGVQALADSAVVVRVMFKTLPLKQWDVAREYRRRIKRRFDDEDIEIPFPHRTIYLGDGSETPPAWQPRKDATRLGDRD